MIISLPQPPARWTPEYQAQVNTAIEQAFQRLFEYARIPAGGTAGQKLVKTTDRDYDVSWTA